MDIVKPKPKLEIENLNSEAVKVEKKPDVSVAPQDRRFEDPRKELYSWQADEYVKYEKTRRWYLIGGAVILILIVIAAFGKNVLMAITFFLIGVVGYLFTKKDPRVVNFKIMSGGIEADGIFYDYDSLKSFWIFYNGVSETSYVSVQRKNSFLPYLNLPLGEEDPNLVRRSLLSYLSERKHKEDISSVVEKIFRF